MEGLNTGKKIENIEAGDKNMEAERRVAEMFASHKITPEEIRAHGVQTERN